MYVYMCIYIYIYIYAYVYICTYAFVDFVLVCLVGSSWERPPKWRLYPPTLRMAVDVWSKPSAGRPKPVLFMILGSHRSREPSSILRMVRQY